MFGIRSSEEVLAMTPDHHLSSPSRRATRVSIITVLLTLITTVGTAAAQPDLLTNYLQGWMNLIARLAQIVILLAMIGWVTRAVLSGSASGAIRGIGLGAIGIFLVEFIAEIFLNPVRNRSTPSGGNSTGNTSQNAIGAVGDTIGTIDATAIANHTLHTLQAVASHAPGVVA